MLLFTSSKLSCLRTLLPDKIIASSAFFLWLNGIFFYFLLVSDYLYTSFYWVCISKFFIQIRNLYVKRALKNYPISGLFSSSKDGLWLKKKKGIDFILMEECFQIIRATTTGNKFYFNLYKYILFSYNLMLFMNVLDLPPGFPW